MRKNLNDIIMEVGLSVFMVMFMGFIELIVLTTVSNWFPKGSDIVVAVIFSIITIGVSLIQIINTIIGVMSYLQKESH